MLIINICLGVLLLYVLEFAGVVNYFSIIKQRTLQASGGKKTGRSDDPFLIEKEEYKKLLSSIEIREADINVLQKELDEKAAALDTRDKQLTEQNLQIQKIQEQMARAAEEKADYRKKVGKLAEGFANMEPEKSVERILALADDLLILDVLARMDQASAEQGKKSIVPYLYSLMPKEDASRLLKKSTVTP